MQRTFQNAIKTEASQTLASVLQGKPRREFALLLVEIKPSLVSQARAAQLSGRAAQSQPIQVTLVPLSGVDSNKHLIFQSKNMGNLKNFFKLWLDQTSVTTLLTI